MSIFSTIAVVKILELSSAFYPEKNGVFEHSESFILPPQNTTVQFNGHKNILCGPSPYINTLNCFSTKFTHFAQSIPIPGDLSATPVFADDSWIIGTTKGFLYRVKTKSQKDFLPSVDPANTELWGSDSRQVMDAFVPKTIYKEPGAKTSPINPQAQQIIPKNYFWVFPTSSPFVGTPVVMHGFVYGLTANQSLQAIDFATGKLAWSVKVAPDVSFYLENLSLRVTEHAVLIGTNRGNLLVLDPNTGNQINNIVLNTTNEQLEDRFAGVVAAPLILPNNHMIVSNAMSLTQKVSLETFEPSWTYPAGSITTPLILDTSTLILTTSDGKIVSVNEQTGSIQWSTNLDKSSPLVDTTLINDNKTLLVATKRGELIALDARNGKILAQNRSIGTVVGFFFQIQDNPNASCLSFSTGSFRCFRVKI